MHGMHMTLPGGRSHAGPSRLRVHLDLLPRGPAEQSTVKSKGQSLSSSHPFFTQR